MMLTLPILMVVGLVIGFVGLPLLRLLTGD
jgi:hypothetical protein